jgi:hypothetical protein
MLNLNKNETLNIYNDYVGFYDEFTDIESYYRYKKRKRMEELPSSLSLFGLGPEGDLFDNSELAPEDMEFEIIHTSDKPVGGKLLTKDYTTLLEITASFNVDNSPGRSSRFGIKEKTTGKFVGFIKLGSPVINIKPRNVFFNVKQTPLNLANKHFVNGFNIVPSQPFGYNCLGGKLIALICISHELREYVNNKYEEMEALFFETTSLYGSIKGTSQYDGLKPYIRHKGDTESKLLLNVSDDLYKKTRLFLEEKNGGNPLVPDDQAIPTSRKFRTQSKILSILKEHLKKYDMQKYNNLMEVVKEKMAITTQKRYYVSDYGYENTKDYIFGKTNTLVKKPNFDNYYFDNLVKWWKIKAQKRWENVKKDGRLRKDLEFWTVNNIDKIDIIR